MPIFLMRHPETTGVSGRCIGHTDVPLSADGQSAIPSLVSTALERSPDAVISSDLTRCRTLALAIYAAGTPIWTQSPAWRELHFGTWENRTWDDICETESAAYETWSTHYIESSPPGGESFTALHRRAWFALDQIREADLGTVLVVTHAGVIRALLAGPTKEAFNLKVPFGSIHPVPDTP